VTGLEISVSEWGAEQGVKSSSDAFHSLDVKTAATVDGKTNPAV
jgi:hypothetical protein